MPAVYRAQRIGGAPVYSAGLDGALVVVTFRPAESAGTDLFSAQASGWLPVSVSVAAQDAGEDLFSVLLVTGVPLPVNVVVNLTEGLDDVFSARGSVGATAVQAGAIAWTVPPEYRLWPVL